MPDNLGFRSLRIQGLYGKQESLKANPDMRLTQCRVTARKGQTFFSGGVGSGLCSDFRIEHDQTPSPERIMIGFLSPILFALIPTRVS